MSAPQRWLELAEDRDAWNRQPGEAARQYERFIVFRDAGPARTLTETAQRVGLSYPRLREIAKRDRWVQRAEAWDAQQQRVHDAEVSIRLRQQRENLIGVNYNLAARSGRYLLTQPLRQLAASEHLRAVEQGTRGFQQLTAQSVPSVVVNAQASASATAEASSGELAASIADMSRAERREYMREVLAEMERRAGRPAPLPGAATRDDEQDEVEFDDPDEVSSSAGGVPRRDAT